MDITSIPNISLFVPDNDPTSVSQRLKRWSDRFDNLTTATHITDNARKKALLLHVARRSSKVWSSPTRRDADQDIDMGVRVYPYPRVRVGSGTGTTSTGTGIPGFTKEHDFFTIWSENLFISACFLNYL